MTTDFGSLFLLPNLLAPQKEIERFFPQSVFDAVLKLDGLIAESMQGGRSFLQRFKLKKRPHLIPIALYNEHSTTDDLDFLLEPLFKGETWGLISDAGLPCIADPGTHLVRRAKEKGLTIEAFVGPSSIFMALMLSGLSGQRFSFHGYLNKKPEERKNELKILEDESYKKNMTQLFIEAPYRNENTFHSMLEILNPHTMICIAIDLTLPTQEVMTDSVKGWKKRTLPQFDKRPILFLIGQP